MNLNFRDILERAVVTFLQAFLSVFVVADLASAEAAVVAGAAAVLSLVKGIAASQFGDGTPSALS
ncbi:Holin [Candidatus Pacearchaeota archaeon]|nr:Holin [Candidatus Pacearchaeota archaeon]